MLMIELKINQIFNQFKQEFEVEIHYYTNTSH